MGHYAGTRLNPTTGQVELIRAVDDNKDQTYFLAQLSQDQIKRVLFPLQSYKKSEIRQIAQDNDLITANKKDSTGICFIGEREFTKFLQNYIPSQPGKIIDITNNQELGEHIGAMYYTIGQRKGLDLGGQKEPYYVAKKDVKNKVIYVAPASNDHYLFSKSTLVTGIN
jgi:tRNA-specific 2-thiouridylase